jgi:hypothetical protein
MKFHAALALLLLVFAFSLSSCTSLSTTTASTSAATLLSSSDAQSAALVTLETAGNFAMASQKAGTDKTVIAQQLVAFGQAVNGLASGSVVTPTQLNAAISSTSPKLASQVATYSAFTTVLSSWYASQYPQLVANGDAKLAATWLGIVSQAAIEVGQANGGGVAQ